MVGVSCCPATLGTPASVAAAQSSEVVACGLTVGSIGCVWAYVLACGIFPDQDLTKWPLQ